MNDSALNSTSTRLGLTADIVAAFVSNNSVGAEALPALIASVDAALKSLSHPTRVFAAPVALVPAVPVKKSVTAEFIICLEDGKKFKSLKRHLRTSYNLTPDEYRTKWNLPADYPMVAPAYAERRSALAKAAGLGQMRKVKAPPRKPGAKTKSARA